MNQETTLKEKIKIRLANYKKVYERDGHYGKLCWREELPGEEYFSVENMYVDPSKGGRNAGNSFHK